MSCVTPGGGPVLVSPYECRFQGDRQFASAEEWSHPQDFLALGQLSQVVFPGAGRGAEWSVNLVTLNSPCVSLGTFQP